MAQDTFIAPCGCIWHGEQHYHKCVRWHRLVEMRDRLIQEPKFGGKDRLAVEDEMQHHRPPRMFGEEAR